MGSGHRRLARLHPGDDERRSLARLLRTEHSVPAHRDALRSCRPPCLYDIDLAARGIDPHPEPVSSGSQNTVSFSTFNFSTFNFSTFNFSTVRFESVRY